MSQAIGDRGAGKRGNAIHCGGARFHRVSDLAPVSRAGELHDRYCTARGRGCLWLFKLAIRYQHWDNCACQRIHRHYGSSSNYWCRAGKRLAIPSTEVGCDDRRLCAGRATGAFAIHDLTHAIPRTVSQPAGRTASRGNGNTAQKHCRSICGITENRARRAGRRQKPSSPGTRQSNRKKPASARALHSGGRGTRAMYINSPSNKVMKRWSGNSTCRQRGGADHAYALQDDVQRPHAGNEYGKRCSAEERILGFCN